MLMACNFINNEILCAFTGVVCEGECISGKNNGSPLFLLEMNFTMDIRYFSSCFHHAFMLQQFNLIFDKLYLFISFWFQVYCLEIILFPQHSRLIFRLKIVDT